MNLQYLYHASPTSGIEWLSPAKRYTPTAEGDSSPLRVYASDLAAYAAAHGFAWQTSEGFQLNVRNESPGSPQVVFTVPQQFYFRLAAPVFIYRVPADSFICLDKIAPKGRNFVSCKAVRAVHCTQFESVESAIIKSGGQIIQR